MGTWLEPEWEPGWEPEWEPGWNLDGYGSLDGNLNGNLNGKLDGNLNGSQTGSRLGPNEGPLEAPWGSLGASLELPGRTHGGPQGSRAPGTPKVPKVCNCRQKQAGGQTGRHRALPDFGTP